MNSNMYNYSGLKSIILSFVVLVGGIGCTHSNEPKTTSLTPSYSTLNAVDLYTGKGKAGEVLIPSVSRTIKPEEREKMLRNIMKSEGWVIISGYSTQAAFNEKSCAPYATRSKGFKEGYLGKVDENGVFSE